MAWIRIKAKEPRAKGGGALSVALEASGRGAAQAIRGMMRGVVETVVNETVQKAGPGTNRDGWPIGPPKRRGHIHSYTRFRLLDESRGWFIRIVIDNSANYAMFIYEPGSKRSRLVWPREIGNPLQTMIPNIGRQIRDAVAVAYGWK